MKKLFKITIICLLIIPTIIGCSDNNSNKETKQTTETNKDAKADQNVASSKMIDLFEIVDINTGFRTAFVPMALIKLRNVSGKSIDKKIEIRYVIIYNDEIIDEWFVYVHNSFDIPWDDKLSKTIEIHCRNYQFKLLPKEGSLRTKIVFEDGSLIYDGIIQNKFIATY